MMHTPAQVAAKLKRPARTIAHVAAEHGIGTKVNERMRMYSDADVKRLRKVLANRKRGRPRLDG